MSSFELHNWSEKLIELLNRSHKEPENEFMIGDALRIEFGRHEGILLKINCIKQILDII